VSNDSNEHSNGPDVTENLDNIARKMGINQLNNKKASAETQQPPSYTLAFFFVTPFYHGIRRVRASLTINTLL